MRSERGYALVLVLILLGLGGLVIGPSLSLSFGTLKSRDVFNDDIKNDYAIQAAIEYSMWLVNWEPGYAATLTVGVESDPFPITFNGVTATGLVLADIVPNQLSGRGLAGPAVGKFYFKVTKAVSPTSASPSVQTEFTYSITIQCLDLNGCDGAATDLEQITDELPHRGAGSGDYLRYVPSSVTWDQTEWGIAAFEPSISTLGSGSSLRERVQWTFTPDIQFPYGDIKTLSFKAEAALPEGYYCNWIYVDPMDSNWRPTMQAEIVVGSPSTTLCPGDNLKITKTSSLLDIPPDVLSTITYTITIENTGDTTVELKRIEDWLPSVGSSNPNDGFVYVDDSTSAYFNRSSAPILFYDGFNRNNSNTVGNWTDGDGPQNDCKINNNKVELRDGCAITQSAVSTVGYTNIRLSYSYWPANDAESGDRLKVEWKPNSSSTWSTLANHGLDEDDPLLNGNYMLPTTAGNTTIDLRFTGDTDGEYVRVDDVKVSVPGASIAFDGFESGDGDGGTGSWNGSWTISGDAAFRYHDANPQAQGDWQLRLRSSDGYAERSVDLSGLANPYLWFWARIHSFENDDTADVLVSTDGVAWDVLRTFVDGEDDNVHHQYGFDISSYGSPSTFYVAFDANMSSNFDYFYIDDVEFNDSEATTTPVCMPDATQSTTFLDETWQSSDQRWSLEWDFGRYPSDGNDPEWDAGGVCAGIPWADYDPLPFESGDIFTMSFQATATVSESGTHYNELILEGENTIPAWFFTGPTAAVAVPHYDLKAVTPISILRGKSKLTGGSIELQSWHWKKHR